MAIDKDTKNYVDTEIRDAMSFSTTKYGDTPTDAQQLTPKGYVDAQISSVSSSIPTTAWVDFGDASDGVALFNGSASVSGASIIASNTYKLTRSVFYQAVSIASGISLQPVNQRIFSKTSWVNSGSILSNGGNGQNGFNGGDATGSGGGGASSVATGGASVAVGYFTTLGGPLGTSGSGGGGPTANSAQPGNDGVIGVSVLSALINNPTADSGRGSNSGSGGNAGGFGGGALAHAGSIQQAIQYTKRPTLPFFWGNAFDYVSTNPFGVSVFGGMPASGGSAGGASGANTANSYGGGGGGGAGGGGNGGIIMVAAPVIVNNGLIQAIGGNGGNGGNGGAGNIGTGTAAGGGGGGGAGGGGSGGIFYYITHSYTNTGTIDLSGGSIGSVGGGGAGAGTGNPGATPTNNAVVGTAGFTVGIVL